MYIANSCLESFKLKQKEVHNKLLCEIEQNQKDILNTKLILTSLEEEKVLLIRQIETFKAKHGMIKDAYEELLIEQFETMRLSFIKKIEEMNSDITITKSTLKKTILYLEEELKQEKQIKEVFLKQLTDYQKIIQDNKLN